MTGELVVLGAEAYEARVTPLRSGGRRDVEVTPLDADLPRAFGATDLLAVLRSFFDQLDREADRYAHDPVALAQALARMETLLADVRSVRDTMKALTAAALDTARVRRLTVQGVVTVEATSEVKRTGWEHHRLLAEVLDRSGLALLDRETGEVSVGEEAANRLMVTMRPEWKLSALRDLGVDPDQFCVVATDDDGKTVRTPAVRIVDNITRRITTTTQETEQ